MVGIVLSWKSLYWHVGNICDIRFDELPNGKPHPFTKKWESQFILK